MLRIMAFGQTGSILVGQNVKGIQYTTGKHRVKNTPIFFLLKTFLVINTKYTFTLMSNFVSTKFTYCQTNYI